MLYSIKYAKVKGSRDGTKCGRSDIERATRSRPCSVCKAQTYFQYDYYPVCSDQCFKILDEDDYNDSW